MTDRSIPRKTDDLDIASMKHDVLQACIACHAERLGVPVLPEDCLGFAACETCAKLPEDGNEPMQKS